MTNNRREWDSVKEAGTATDAAAQTVRIICGVPSRAMIPNDAVALERWQHLLSRYEQYKTDQQYGDRR